jgi:hypothetical protein
MRILFAVLRAVVGLAIVAAIIGQLITSVNFWTRIHIHDITTQVVNFFSFFTIESNIAAFVVLVIGSYLLFRGRTPDPAWYLGTRAAVVTYMVVTGIVYNLLLRGISQPEGTVLGWSNEVLHAVAPAYLLLDWIFAPGRTPMPWKRIWAIIIFPLVWAVYTMIRGPFTPDAVFHRNHWYPYPFLNPNTSPQGYFTVAFYVVLIAAVIGLVAAGVIWISRRGAVAREAAAE